MVTPTNLKPIRAKFKGQCAETGKAVVPNQPVLWAPGRKMVFSYASDTAAQWLEAFELRPAAGAPS